MLSKIRQIENEKYHMIFIHACVASLVVQMVKNLPVMQETWVQSLGQEYTTNKINDKLTENKLPEGKGV